MSGDRKAKALGDAGYATWQKDRLCALVADERGEFSTHTLVFNGRQLSFNMASEGHGAYVNVEVRAEKGNPIPGLTFAESDPLSGDCLDLRASWCGRTD